MGLRSIAAAKSLGYVFLGLLLFSEALADRQGQVADRFNVLLPPALGLDLPGGQHEYRGMLFVGNDFLAPNIGYWCDRTVPRVGLLLEADTLWVMGKDFFLRGAGAYSLDPKAWSETLQIGYQVLPGAFDNAGLTFMLGASHVGFDGNHAIVPALSGQWSLELFRLQTARDIVLRGGIQVGMDLGFVAWDDHKSGTRGFTPIRFGVGWFQAFQYSRLLLYFDGTRDGRFRLLFGLGFRAKSNSLN